MLDAGPDVGDVESPGHQGGHSVSVIEDPQWGVRMEAMTRTTTPDVRPDDPMMSIMREQSNPLPSLIKDI